jgi:hypothetical protein
MNADNRQMLVERYLSGEMSPSESGEFDTLLQNDLQLRRLLDAERVIVGAVARDRAMMPPASTVPPAALMAALEVGRQIVPAASSATAWISAKTAAIVATIGIVGVVAGTIFIAPLFKDEPAPQKSVPTEAPAMRQDAAVETPDPVQSDVTTDAAVAAPEPAAPRVQDAPRPRTVDAPTPAASDRTAPRSSEETSIDELPVVDSQKVDVEVNHQQSSGGR